MADPENGSFGSITTLGVSKVNRRYLSGWIGICFDDLNVNNFSLNIAFFFIGRNANVRRINPPNLQTWVSESIKYW